MKIEVNKNFRYFPENSLWRGWFIFKFLDIEDETLSGKMIEILRNYDFEKDEYFKFYAKEYENVNIDIVLIQMNQDEDKIIDELSNLYKYLKKVFDQKYFLNF